MSWYPRACPVCSGDLYDDLLDVGWVTCMMCARTFDGTDVLSVQRIVKGSAERRDRPAIPDLLAS